MIRKAIASLLSPRVRAKIIHWDIALKETLRGSVVAKMFRKSSLQECFQRPEQVDIEVTSQCDADCIMCPRRSMSRKQEGMNFDLFRKIVDEAISMGVPKLVLNGYGEISVLKENEAYLAYIRQKSKSVKIVVNTNAMRMNAVLRAAYLKHGVDVVNVTIDGATAATFEAIRRHLKLEDVESNVRGLIRERDEKELKRPFVGVFMIVMEQNRHETTLFEKKWKGVADHVGLTGLVSRIGSVSGSRHEESWTKTPCYYLWNQLPVLSDGTVALCCDDWNGKAKLGKIGEISLTDVWQSMERKRLRQIHLSGKADSIPLCAGCKQPRRGPWWFPTVTV